MRILFIFLSLSFGFQLQANPNIESIELPGLAPAPTSQETEKTGATKSSKKDDILEDYFAKADDEEGEKKGWSLGSMVRRQIRKDPNNKETLFYHLTQAPDRFSLSNRFYMSYEGFNLPIIPFMGADFYHHQNDHNFSGLGAAVGAYIELFRYTTVSADASFRQTLEYWSIPRNNLKLSAITRSVLGLKFNLEATNNFKLFFGVDISNVWEEGSVLASVPSDIKPSIERRFNYSYGILIRI